MAGHEATSQTCDCAKMSKTCLAPSLCPHDFWTCLCPRDMSWTCPGHVWLLTGNGGGGDDNYIEDDG